MAIRDWPPGKLVVLWVGTLFTEFLLLLITSELRVGALLVVTLLGVPMYAALYLTWRWFTEREKR